MIIIECGFFISKIKKNMKKKINCHLNVLTMPISSVNWLTMVQSYWDNYVNCKLKTMFFFFCFFFLDVNRNRKYPRCRFLQRCSSDMFQRATPLFRSPKVIQKKKQNYCDQQKKKNDVVSVYYYLIIFLFYFLFLCVCLVFHHFVHLNFIKVNHLFHCQYYLHCDIAQLKDLNELVICQSMNHDHIIPIEFIVWQTMIIHEMWIREMYLNMIQIVYDWHHCHW